MKLIIIFLFATGILLCQSINNYNPHEVFDPSFDSNPGTIYRSGSGAPGPAYWQNSANYKISVKLDDKKNTIDGNVEIDYTNNSPDNLTFVWLELDQNRFKVDNLFKPQIDSLNFNGGFKIKSVMIEYNGVQSAADYIVVDTRMQIRLPYTLKSKGGILKIYISYSFEVAPRGFGRSGFMSTRNGKI